LTTRVWAVALGAFIVALAVCGWFEAAMHPFGIESSTVTFLVAAALLVVGFALDHQRVLEPELSECDAFRPARDTSLRFRGMVTWVLAVGFVIAVELWELFHSPRSLYPTLSSLANDIIGPGHRVGRAVAFVCWGICGPIVASRPRRRV